MTRINCIPVQELHDKHLIAEYRELPRVIALAGKAWQRQGPLSDIPRSYTLGKGHVRFFYNKIQYILHRYCELIEEMGNRGFTTNFQYDTLVHKSIQSGIPTEWICNWVPSRVDMLLNRSRINQRLIEMGVRTSEEA